MPAHAVPIDVKEQGVIWLLSPYNWSIRHDGGEWTPERRSESPRIISFILLSYSTLSHAVFIIAFCCGALRLK